MDHPYAPLMLADLLRAEPPSAARDRRNLQAFLESRPVPRVPIVERLRALTHREPSSQIDLACCTA